MISKTQVLKKPTKFITAKGYARLWMLRNLKRFGASTMDLVDVYEKQCRSVLELAVLAWSPGLSINDANRIERVQKTALAIILGDGYISYDRALRTLNMDTLSDRRRSLCMSFAKKAYVSDKFNSWFSESGDNSDTVLKVVKTRTSRYRKSPLPYLTDLLNQEFSK